MCTTMYKLKPIITNFNIEFPNNNMYKVKNVLNDSEISEINYGPGVSVTKSSFMWDKRINEQIQAIIKKKLPEMDALEKRQAVVLRQLEELQKQIQLMNNDLQMSIKPKQAANTTIETGIKLKSINEANLNDLVINVNPSTVPYSLLAIRNLWKGRLNIKIQCFSHSTISQVTDEVKQIVEKFQVDLSNDNSHPTLNISLIWKNVGKNAELNSSQTLYVPIYGEVNIIRYLSRIGPNEFDYENDSNVNEIDIIFDLCYQLCNCSTILNRQNYIRALNNRLKFDYFGNNCISLADIAVYSIVKQNKDVLKDLTPNLKKWYQKAMKKIEM